MRDMIQSTIPLWPGSLAREMNAEPPDAPALTLYPHAGARAAVLVLPGGGYGALAAHEAEPVAQWLNSLGIASGVLRYRLGPRYRHPAMRDDVNRGIRLMRHHTAELGLTGSKIGVLGFSAGGHLAATASTQFSAGDAHASDAVERQSSRPDASILVYPVITLRHPHTHGGSRLNLLGPDASEALVDEMSAERRVTRDTPPTFLFHTVDDPAVPVENALLYADALRRHGVIFEMHLYQTGHHGVGLARENPVLRTWTERCADWLRGQGF